MEAIYRLAAVAGALVALVTGVSLAPSHSGDWAAKAADWEELRAEAMAILQREERLQQIVRLVGPDALPESQRWILFVAELLKDGFLAQSAFDETDSYCAPERQVALLRLLLSVHRRGKDAIQAGIPTSRLRTLPCVVGAMRARSTFGNAELAALSELQASIDREFDSIGKEAP